MEKQSKTGLVLYFRHGCHLCEDMQTALKALPEFRDIDLKLIDVDSSNELQQLYGLKVPVLKMGEQEICHYELDAVSLRHALEADLN